MQYCIDRRKRNASGTLIRTKALWATYWLGPAPTRRGMTLATSVMEWTGVVLVMRRFRYETPLFERPFIKFMREMMTGISACFQFCCYYQALFLVSHVMTWTVSPGKAQPTMMVGTAPICTDTHVLM